MDFKISDNARDILALAQDFFEREILPRNREMIRAIRLHGDFDPPFLADLRRQAKDRGLWNMAMTDLDTGYEGTPLNC